MKDDGWGMGIGLSPGGALRGPGEGVPTGPPAAYGFVTKDVSDTIESMGSRSMGCFPARFDEGDGLEGSDPQCCPMPLRSPCDAVGTANVLGSLLVILVAVMGGWL